MAFEQIRLQSLPIDSVPCFCPTWDEIKGKAHLYRTARLRSTGQYVQLLRIVNGLAMAKPLFACRLAYTQDISHHPTEELCDFCP